MWCGVCKDGEEDDDDDDDDDEEGETKAKGRLRVAFHATRSMLDQRSNARKLRKSFGITTGGGGGVEDEDGKGGMEQ